jgi:hypothetical protein
VEPPAGRDWRGHHVGEQGHDGDVLLRAQQRERHDEPVVEGELVGVREVEVTVDAPVEQVAGVR